MTDDFHLFADPNDGEPPINPDLALMSAYLARELSPLQVLGVEERLATDPAFRARMQPLLDSWAAPVASLSGGWARPASPLSTQEQSDSWRRFQREAERVTSITPTHTHTRTNTRRTSMKRIAVIGIAVLPMVSFAQAVVYSANHLDAPGHTVARRIVEIVAHDNGVPKPTSQRSGATPQGMDAPVGRQLRGAAAVGATSDVAGQPGVEPAPRVEPDRAKIAGLVKEHQPAVARGDTTVEYVVMVLDAAGKYVWSTIGNGNLSIEIAGDPRTPAERTAYLNEHRADFWGATGQAPRFVIGHILRDSISTFWPAGKVVVGRARGGVLDTTIFKDSIGVKRSLHWTAADVRILHDSTLAKDLHFFPIFKAAASGARGGGGGRGGALDTSAAHLRIFLDSALVAHGARGGGRGGTSANAASDQPGVYRNGWAGTRNGPLANQASGLQDPAPGQSGIQGLPSIWVSSAETYHFDAGELAPKVLQVMVIQMTPNATWRGRF